MNETEFDQAVTRAVEAWFVASQPTKRHVWERFAEGEREFYREAMRAALVAAR